MGKIVAVIIILAVGGFVFSFMNKNQKVEAPIEMSKAPSGGPEKFTPPTTPPPSDSGVNAPVKEITLKASNWLFEPSEIRVKEGDRVKITLEGISGTHAITLPDFGVKSKTIGMGETTTVEFVADKKGIFSFKCSVFCGEGHPDMKGDLIVE